MPAIVRRLAMIPALLVFVVTITFALVQIAPGDAADVLIAPGARADEIARLRATLQLDRPPAAQYAAYVGRLLTGDLGYSVSRGQPVRDVLRDALPATLLLGGISLACTFVIGITIGAWQAARRGRALDAGVTVVGTIVGAMPAYWLALLLVVLFTSGAAAWGWPPALRLPAFGARDAALAALGIDSVADRLRHLVLPVAVLSLIGAAGIMRYARGTLVRVLDDEAMRTARAKGASRSRVLWRHALRSASAPLIVLLALALPGVVSGSVFVEQIFAYPGMGRTMLLAITSRDIPLVMGCTVLFAAVVAVSNLSADLVLAALDPRQRDRAAARP
ncbi:MAG: ABC transporter permease [Gemmatimonadaceae bacterium]|jgi:peptide/nickel transport system permease protein|nr:ABC transporter permease [Gemmatimonadaceae bacterium]